MADEVIQTEVTPAEEITPDGGSPQEAGESGGVTASEVARLREELERERKNARAFQAEKDRLDAENKKRERSELDEVERLKLEKADAEAKAVAAEQMASFYYTENLKNEVTAEFNLPPAFKDFLHGVDEDDLKLKAQRLAELIAQMGTKGAEQVARETEVEAPTVTGGSGISPDIVHEYEQLVSKAKSSGDFKPLIDFKRKHKK